MKAGGTLQAVLSGALGQSLTPDQVSTIMNAVRRAGRQQRRPTAGMGGAAACLLSCTDP